MRTRTAASSHAKRVLMRGDGRRAPCAYGWRGTRSRLQQIYASLLAGTPTEPRRASLGIGCEALVMAVVGGW